ncbi:unnamed protein product [Musa acuminata subsp. burmannicoides]
MATCLGPVEHLKEKFVTSLLFLPLYSSNPILLKASCWLIMAHADDNVEYEEEFIETQRGARLFTCRFVQRNVEPKALIFLCHGYGSECSISMRDIAIRLAKAGYAVRGVDYEGHGKSSGLRGYISSFDDLVSDCSDYFMSVCERRENKKKPRYLFGLSMGGAVALLLHLKAPTYWSGAVLVSPMCKIDGKMKPHPLVISILKKLCSIIPTWKMIPAKDMIDIAIKDPEKRQEVRSNPYNYRGNLRLGTGHELLKVSLAIERNLHQVTLPFLVMHGGDDKIFDPSSSELLYKSASSTDKTFKVYDGMWHAFTFGEAPERVELVFSDMVAWLEQRTMKTVVAQEASC